MSKARNPFAGDEHDEQSGDAPGSYVDTEATRAEHADHPLVPAPKADDDK